MVVSINPDRTSVLPCLNVIFYVGGQLRISGEPKSAVFVELTPPRLNRTRFLRWNCSPRPCLAADGRSYRERRPNSLSKSSGLTPVPESSNVPLHPEKLPQARPRRCRPSPHDEAQIADVRRICPMRSKDAAEISDMFFCPRASR